MIRFSEEKVLLLHQLMVAETGGSNELRDIGLLDSALEGIFQTFGGEELYPTKVWDINESVPRLKSSVTGRLRLLSRFKRFEKSVLAKLLS